MFWLIEILVEIWPTLTHWKWFIEIDSLKFQWLIEIRLHFVQPLQILKMGEGSEGCGKSALAHSPQRWFGANDICWTLILHRLICLVSRSSCLCCQTREWALWSKEYCPFEMIAEAAKYSKFCRSCLSCLTLFCSNKLSGCAQCAQTDGKTVKAVMAASSFPSILAATTPAHLI